MMKRTNQFDAAWTKAEDELVRKYYDDMTWQELSVLIKQECGTDRTWSAVSSRALKKLGLKKSFNRGDIKKGENRNKKELPIGAERKVYYSHGRFSVFVKINNIPGTMGMCVSQNPNWKRKDYIVWEAAGKPPVNGKHEMLIHLDGNQENCDISNLYKIDRRINFMLSKNKWQFETKNEKLAAIKYAELFYVLKEADSQ